MSASSPTFELLPTGVPNLDPVLGGGLRRGALAILMGPPGSGKTILVGRMGFAAARQGDRVLILTALSEPTTKIIEPGALLGFSTRSWLASPFRS